MPHLTPVGGNHIGRGRQPRGATEFRHHFAARETLLGPAGILGIRQHTFELFTYFDRFIKRPCTVWIKRHARLWEAFCQRGNGLCLFFTRQHAAFQFEIIEAIFFVCRFRQPHHRIRGHRLFMAQPVPVACFLRLALVRQRRQCAIADKEQIAKHFYF